jgi:malate dehydrogenase (quinone)
MKLDSLREFVPKAEAKDWTYYEAGQRAQVIKPVKGGGVLQFGTEVIASKDGSMAGLLGASPGASVSVSVMLDVMKHLYADSFSSYTAKFKELMPGYDQQLNKNPKLAKEVLAQTAKVLKLKA